ncbi:glycoside hydrolase family 18 protein [Pseudoalteromonas sp. MMG012]|uniref:glycoside hydrolase family 18 protein n=1 Tax=Pseudoalteromonas sp. MMG012 TaxID=2822686 RepID=UPI001B39DAB7|nr:glycoside hydrolase family 18 protein [Pseudoalteromonas sp. MMG012]MBQ4851192.1 glycoside hydrolase family 18 protein [Pseudoalteromonas sp. MMG012]
MIQRTLLAFCLGAVFNSHAAQCPRVEGYYATWQYPLGGALAIEELNSDALTHIILAFAFPTEGGGLDTSLVDFHINDALHFGRSNNVGVILSIGGAGVNFLNLTKSDLDTLAENITHYAIRHQLDGIDIDWEHFSTYEQPNPIESSNHHYLLKRLHELLPSEIDLGTDVEAGFWSGPNYHADLDIYADYIRFMAYNFTGQWPGSFIDHHSAWLYTKMGLESNIPGINSMAQKYSREKTLLGLPFYHKGFVNGQSDQVNIVTTDYIVENSVRNLGLDFNSGHAIDDNIHWYWETPKLIQKKSQYVKDNNYPGVFIWELHQDSRDSEHQLLNAIAQVLPKCDPCNSSWQGYPTIYTQGDTFSFKGNNYRVESGPIYDITPETQGHQHRFSEIGGCKTNSTFNKQTL